MNWLVKYKVTIDYDKKLIAFYTLEGEKLEFRGNNHQKVISTISSMQAFGMLKKG